MAFHVYPDPATAPLTIAGSATAAAVPIVELTSVPSGGLANMFITFAATPPVLGAAPAAPARPTVSLSANGGAAVTVTSVGGVNPTEVLTGLVYGSVTTEGNGVHRLELFKFSTTPVTWTVTFTNNDAAEIRLTWVVADSQAEARKAWAQVPDTVDWDALVGQTLTSQDVSLTVDIGNRGTGNLTLALATGVVGASDFEVVAVPASIAPGTADGLDLAFHAPATPGAVSGVTVELGSNDPQEAVAVPAHPTSTDLAASRGRLEVMLLLDASGSMGYQPDGSLVVAATDSRWAKMTSAATQFLHLLEDFSDGLGRFGVSVFPNITDPAFFPPTAQSPSAAHLHAPGEINPGAISTAIAALAVDDPPQPSGGATPIGFGIGHTMGDTAGSFGDFEPSADAVAHNRRFIVLMSDGAQNSGPHPSIYWRTAEGTGCGDPGTAGPGRSFLDKKVKAITVAYGDPAVTAFEVDHDLLALIACKSGGTALDALADDAGLALMKSFRDALVDGLALDPTVDPGGVLTSGQPSVRRKVSVLPFDQQVAFVADWVSDRERSLRIDLLTPDCDLLSSSGPARPGVSVHVGPRHVVVTVDESYLRNDADPAQPRHGEWTMVITAEGLGEEGFEQYQYAVLTRSRLRLRLRPSSSGYVAGDEIGLSADLRLDGRPVRDASITVFHDHPEAGALNWLAAQSVTADEMDSARDSLGDLEATTIGVKAHALQLRGVHFEPFGQQSVLTMAATPDGYALTVPGNTVPGTYDFRAVAVGEVDGVPFRREQRVQVRVGVRPDPSFTLVHVGSIFIADRLATVVQVWPRDRFGNVVLIDPAIDPSIGITVAGAKPVGGVRTEHDGSYVQVVDLQPGETPKVTVTVDGRPVVTDLPVPALSGLHYAQRVLDHAPGAEAEPGANQHADPTAVLGDPGAPPQDFLALGAGGHVSVAAEEHVLARGDDDVNVVVARHRDLRSYRVQAQQPITRRWIDIGSSEGVSASFGLRPAGLVYTSAVRVVDTSGRTREADLSVSRAPGAQVVAVGFRAVGEAPPGCGLPGPLGAVLAWLLRLLRGDRAARR